MGSSVSSGRNNDELVDNLVRAKYVRTPEVEQVMRAVDRGHFQQCWKEDWPYKDAAWRRGVLHLSAPCIYSEVLESLQLQPGHSFLNLGSGTGYLSTMAGLLIGPRGTNHGVEINSDVVNYANMRVNAFKRYRVASMDAYDLCEPIFITGDCLRLAPDTCCYDRIYCGASCPITHENYLKCLLKIGGVLVVPLHDHLVQFTRLGREQFEQKDLLPVSFTELLGGLTDEYVHLPMYNPPSLQDLSRYVIRTTIRNSMPAVSCEVIAGKEEEAPCKKPRLRDSSAAGEADDEEQASTSTANDYTTVGVATDEDTVVQPPPFEPAVYTVNEAQLLEDMLCDETVEEASEQGEVNKQNTSEEESNESSSSDDTDSSSSSDTPEDNDDFLVIDSSDDSDLPFNHARPNDNSILVLCNSFSQDSEDEDTVVPVNENVGNAEITVLTAFQQKIDTLPLPFSLKQYLKYQPTM